MSKRARVTANSTSLIPGKIHRRVFTDKNAFPAVGAAPIISPSTAFTFGLDTLPRRPNFVWAAEVVRINYYFQSNKDVIATDNDFCVHFCVSVSNSSELSNFLVTNTGVTNMVRRDEVIDASSVTLNFAGGGGMALRYDSEIAHDTTDLMGQGILVFGDKLYTVTQTTIGNQGELFVIPEIWYRYREVPLEYYLSTQQDAAASGV